MPQLTQRVARSSLSAPQFGQGVYACPQYGQNFDVLGNFFAHLEQNTVRVMLAAVICPLDFVSAPAVDATGAIAAAKIASESTAKIRQIMYTPLEDTFLFPVRNAIAFTGSADPWVGMDNSRISLLCRERNIPCFVIPGANHSLESKDLMADLEHLQLVLRETRKYISEEPRKSSLQ